MEMRLDMEWIVLQNGMSFQGKEIVNHFIDWIEGLECGVDLMTQENFRPPRRSDTWV